MRVRMYVFVRPPNMRLCVGERPAWGFFFSFTKIFILSLSLLRSDRISIECFFLFAGINDWYLGIVTCVFYYVRWHCM